MEQALPLCRGWAEEHQRWVLLWGGSGDLGPSLEQCPAAAGRRRDHGAGAFSTFPKPQQNLVDLIFNGKAENSKPAALYSNQPDQLPCPTSWEALLRSSLGWMLSSTVFKV